NVAAIISDNGGGLIARNGALIGQAGGNFSN
ncbi:MAG: hypothetical protein QOJ57_1148, partial [Thermoleophilaceae bacterium]|nr:hypothetical protein [Thermoleophilaceae bacterium]